MDASLRWGLPILCVLPNVSPCLHASRRPFGPPQHEGGTSTSIRPACPRPVSLVPPSGAWRGSVGDASMSVALCFFEVSSDTCRAAGSLFTDFWFRQGPERLRRRINDAGGVCESAGICPGTLTGSASRRVGPLPPSAGMTPPAPPRKAERPTRPHDGEDGGIMAEVPGCGTGKRLSSRSGARGHRPVRRSAVCSP